MPKYVVQINGRNFLVEVDGQVSRMGFLTHRVVEARDPGAAENAAVKELRETQSLRDLVRNASDDPPTMDVGEIAELEPSGPREELETGLIWYVESPKRWWQFWK
jgi:hypothetical protein